MAQAAYHRGWEDCSQKILRDINKIKLKYEKILAPECLKPVDEIIKRVEQIVNTIIDKKLDKIDYELI